MDTTERKKGHSTIILQASLIFILGLGIYANTVTHGFVLDDALMITNNSFTKQGIGGIPEILTNDAFTGFFGKEGNLLPGGRYRPLSHIMFAVEYELFGLNPLPGHLINILLYAFAGVALFNLLRRLFRRFDVKPWYLSLPFLAAVLYIVHPLHTEVVANIKGRDEILALWGFLGAMWFSVKWAEKGGILYPVLIAAIVFLAILAKESAITFIAAVPLTLWYFEKPERKRLLLSVLPFAAALAGYFLLRASLFGGTQISSGGQELLNDPFLHATTTERLATVMLTWQKYYGLMLVPWPLTHDYYPYHIEIVGFDAPSAIFGLLLTIGLLVYAVSRVLKRDIWAWGILFFFIVFSIYSNLLINIGTFMNERFVFLPLLGYSVLLAMVFHSVMRKAMRNRLLYKRVTLIVFAVAVIVLAGITIHRNFAWADNLTLFTTDVEISENSAKCNVSAGEHLIAAAKLTENPVQKSRYLNQAVGYLQHAILKHRSYYGAWDKLAEAYVYLEEYDKAVRGYLQCASMRPGDTIPVYNLHYIGDRCIEQKDFQSLELAMRSLLRLNPEDALALKGLGVALMETSSPDSAYHYLSLSLEADSTDSGTWNKLAEYYGRYRGDLSAATILLDKAYAVNPEDPNVLENLGVISGMRGNHEAALQWFLKAYNLKPGNLNVIDNIIMTYRVTGNTGEEAAWVSKRQELTAK